MNTTTSKIEVYIGSPIENDSERKAFLHIFSLIQTKNCDAIIIANANIDKVQIDLIVAYEKTAYVIEVKGSYSPIRGDVNGIWEKRTSIGTWSTLKNYYNQTLTAKHAVKDALTKVTGKSVGYPQSTLLFVPGLHPASIVPPGDFKVNIQSLNTVTALNSTSDVGCTLSDWKKFINNYHLQKISVADASFDMILYEAEQLLNRYTASFIRDYGEDIKTLVPVDCVFEGNALSSADIYNVITTNSNFHIIGQSGCAKTLLAKEVGVKYAQSNNIPIYLEAKYFEGLFGPLLNEEIRLLGLPSVSGLFSLSEKLEKEILIIIDGFNECSPQLKERLIRCTLSLCNRYPVKVLLVSQIAEGNLSKLLLKQIEVKPPSEEIKNNIAAIFCPPQSFIELEPMMKAITSGLEARLIGEMGSNNLGKISRFSLFEHFARIKLNNAATVGIKCLSCVGNFLSGKISYSLSLREFDKIIESNNLPPGIKDILLSSNLLQRRFNKITFIHELFLNTFIAQSIVRMADADTELIYEAINAPKNYDKGELIIGAVEDSDMLQSLLEKIDSADLITSLFYGTGGIYCTQWVKRKFTEIIEKIRTESGNISFEIVEDYLRKIKTHENSLLQWSNQENAFIGALPQLLAKGEYINEIFEIIPLMDGCTQNYFKILLPEAKEKKISLWSDLFAAAYVRFSNTECALCRIMSFMHSGFLSLTYNYHDSDKLISRLSMPLNLTDGQMYFVLALNRFNTGSQILFPFILDFLVSKWRYVPYHLRIQLLDSVKYYSAFQEEREKLIAALNNLMGDSNIFISSSIFEALQSLGATEEDEIAHESTVIQEIEILLAGTNGPELSQRAFALYVRQFDHPYAGTYSSVFYSLETEKRKQFLTLAVQGAEGGLFTMPAILELVKMGDPGSCIYFEKWRKVPPEQTSFPQEDIYIFYLTHLLLARFSYPIASLLNSYLSVRDNVLCACAEIFYWINRNDIDLLSRKRACKASWEYLLGTDKMLASEAVWLANSSLRDYYSKEFTEPPVMLIGDVFSEKISEICRKSLLSLYFETRIFQWDKKESAIQHAISILGRYGSIIDVPLLKTFVNDKNYGRNAIDAIKLCQESL